MLLFFAQRNGAGEERVGPGEREDSNVVYFKSISHSKPSLFECRSKLDTIVKRDEQTYRVWGSGGKPLYSSLSSNLKITYNVDSMTA